MTRLARQLGYRVANKDSTTATITTGTMSPDESVGAIGALRQKAIAVRDAGATLFLVPAGQSADEVAAARSAAGTGVRIVQVATLGEALNALVANGGNPLPTK